METIVLKVNRKYAGSYGAKGFPPARTIRAIFNGTILYTISAGERSWEVAYKTCSVRAFLRWVESDLGEAENRMRWDFLGLCRQVVDKLGVDYGDTDSDGRVKIMMGNGYGDDRFPESKGRVYVDDKITIVTNTVNGTMHVEKRENRNPVIHTHKNGEPYRYHGEYIHLVDHVNALLGIEEAANV